MLAELKGQSRCTKIIRNKIETLETMGNFVRIENYFETLKAAGNSVRV